jgi:predicted flap endonuclease-1-like 5' DNA nuclease
MSYYLITTGLFLAAYFLGTWIGCLLRRLVAPGRGGLDEPSVDVPAAAGLAASAVASSSVATMQEPPAPVPSGDRFSRALTGEGQGRDEPPPANERAHAVVAQTAPMKTTFDPVAPRLENIPERAPHVTAPRSRPIPTNQAEGASGTGFVAAEVVVGAVAATTAVALGARAGTQATSPVNDTSATPPVPDDLHLLRGIDDVAISRLHEAGITRFAQIAALTAPEVRRLEMLLGHDGRIAGANWIEQAQVLASGRQTRHARTLHARAGLRLARPGADTGEPLGIVIGAPRSNAVAKPEPESEPIEHKTHDTPGASGAMGATAAATPPLHQGDDLARISGITPEIARALSTRGVTSFAQVAGWTDADVERVESLLGTTGRISRENWIIQSRGFAGLPTVDTELQTTEPAFDDATVASEEGIQPSIGLGGSAAAAIGGLRSVRSEAYTTAPAPTGQPDDLKRIRGVGVLLEKKLHMLGVRTYDQIANWTRSDIDRVNEQLDFHGRIERENWVEQARILLAGGQTQFSRRLDRTRDRRPLSGVDDSE